MRKITILAWLQFVWLLAPAQERQWFSEADITGLNPPAEFEARNNAVSFVIGDTAYVGTGDKGSNTLVDFWKYTPANNTWTRIADFPGTKRANAVAFVIDGKGYVGTGRGDGQIFNDFYRYDPTTNQWEQIANFEGGARHRAIAFAINGKGYVGTGCTSNTSGCSLDSEQSDLWEYDPATNDWTQKASISGPRYGAVAFTVDGKGYIAGGRGSNSSNLREYDPVTDTYEPGGSNTILFTRTDAVAFAVDGRGYIGLGDDESDFFIFDPKIHMPAAGDDFEFPSSNPTGEENNFGDPAEDNRFGAVAFVVRGKAFVGLGGYTNSGTTRKQDIWSFQSPVPDTPEDLTVVASSLDSALLSWTDYANNEQSFRIERSEDDAFGSPEAFSAAANVTQYNDKSVSVDQEYFYRVRANNAPTHSAYSDTVVVNTFTPPSDLSANVTSATEIALQWQDNSTGEQGFVIERRAGNAGFAVIETTEADVTTFSDATVSPGTDYTYRISALATVSRSAASNLVSAGSLVVPTQLVAEVATDSTITISWTYEGTNAAWYLIQRRDPNGEFVLVDSVSAGSSTQYQDVLLSEGTTYEYRVKAVDRPRTSTYSESLMAISQLEAPTALVVTAQDAEVSLVWEDQSEQETRYVIRRSTPEGEWLLLDSLSADATTYTDATITEEGNYLYYVQAVGIGTVSDTTVSDTVTVVFPEEEEEETVTGIDEPAPENEVNVYPNPGSGLVSVFVGDERAAYVAVFNNQGRLVQEIQQAEQAAQPTVAVDIQHLPTGVYTLRIYTARGVSVKKVAKQ